MLESPPPTGTSASRWRAAAESTAWAAFAATAALSPFEPPHAVVARSMAALAAALGVSGWRRLRGTPVAVVLVAVCAAAEALGQVTEIARPTAAVKAIVQLVRLGLSNPWYLAAVAAWVALPSLGAMYALMMLVGWLPVIPLWVLSVALAVAGLPLVVAPWWARRKVVTPTTSGAALVEPPGV